MTSLFSELQQLIVGHRASYPDLGEPFSRFRFYSHTRPDRVKSPTIYHPYIFLVAQGAKVAYHGEARFRYSPGHFLVLTAPLPLQCQVVEATPERPYLACGIPVDFSLLGQLVTENGDGFPSDGDLRLALTLTEATPELMNACTRLLRCLKSEEETRALGEGFLREVYYFVLKSRQGWVLRSYLAHQVQFQALSSVLNHIHAHISEQLSVDSLASRASMSQSTFHRSFKALTDQTPMQYIKSVKLHKAYVMMQYAGSSVGQAADSVGYRSASQFSREFKRAFGCTPTALLKRAAGEITSTVG